MRLHGTHTFVVLELSRAAYDEIAGKLRAAGYEHAFVDGGPAIDMHGLAVQPEAPPATPEGLFDAMDGGGASHA